MNTTPFFIDGASRGDIGILADWHEDRGDDRRADLLRRIADELDAAVSFRDRLLSEGRVRPRTVRLYLPRGALVSSRFAPADGHSGRTWNGHVLADGPGGTTSASVPAPALAELAARGDVEMRVAAYYVHVRLGLTGLADVNTDEADRLVSLEWRMP